MASVSEMFPVRWLKAVDLNGKAFTLAITSTRIEELYNPRTRGEEAKIVVTFHAATKQLICNKTQALAIAAIAGDDTDAWPGHSVTLSAGLAPNGQPTIVISPPPEPEEEEEEEEEPDQSVIEVAAAIIEEAAAANPIIDG